MAIAGARYVHTNLIARDWRALARFYAEVFGCTPVPPERRYAGPELEAGTAVPGASLEGAHLRLPGHGDAGPTLEIFQYADTKGGPPPAANRAGFGHIAFAVQDVPAARAAVLAQGGSTLGEVVRLRPTPDAEVLWCYVRDPEGNLIELQAWSPA